jgi:hypothetical protein
MTVHQKCKAKFVAAGYNEKDTPMITLSVTGPDLDGASDTVLYITDKSIDFQLERLRATGWTGKDLSDMTGVGTKEFDYEIKYEDYFDKEKNETRKVMKTQILTGGGRIQISKPEADLKKFAMKVAMLTGKGKPDGVPPPPFG